MPSPGAGTLAPANSKRQDAARAGAAPAFVPFVRSSAEHRESFLDISRQLTTSDQDAGVTDIPAYGYVRSILIEVTATGGAGAAVTAAEDGPWSVLKSISVTEPNGAVIQAFNSGYSLYLANKYGGYRDSRGADFKASPTYSAIAAASGNFTYLIRVPIELNLRDALGSLANQNASSQFKFRFQFAKLSEVYGTVPTTAPTVRVQAFLEAWDQPESAVGGQVNAVAPPSDGTTQFWSEQVINYSQGQQTLPLRRVGNYLRNLIFVARRSGSRVNGDADFPNPATIYLDTRNLDLVSRLQWKHQMYERSGFGGVVGSGTTATETPQGLDNGVFVYDFAHEFDGTYGRELRDGWLPTLPSTRLELVGSFANAGSLTVLTNDVQITDGVWS